MDTRADQTWGLDANRFSSSQAWHLAEGPEAIQLTDFEFAMLAVHAAFERYAVQTARLCGGPELNFTEVLIIHVVRMHDRPKDAATIARLLNRDDLPNVQYALRKLVTSGLVEKSKLGTATVFSTSDEGVRWTDRYAALRSKVMLEFLGAEDLFAGRLEVATRSAAVLAGMFDSSSRAAALLNPVALATEEQD